LKFANRYAASGKRLAGMSDAITGMTHPRKARNTQLVKDLGTKTTTYAKPIGLVKVADLF
jgi:hypothetical protein